MTSSSDHADGGAAALPSLLAALPPGVLPPGRLVAPQGGGAPRYWLSDAAPAPGVWRRLRDLHPGSGLWPLLLEPLDAREPQRPWQVGEVYPAEPDAPLVSVDAAEFLAARWAEHTDPDVDEDVFEDDIDADRDEVTAPFGRSWPGPAAPVDVPAGAGVAVAASLVDEPAPPPRRSLADRLFRREPPPDPTRLGLVVAARGADAPDAIGWDGAANYAEAAGETGLVLRSWEDRFGIEVLALGMDTLAVAVPVPPRSHDEALRVAAEHFAFCPDLVWQGAETLEGYAHGLVGAHSWWFWWD